MNTHRTWSAEERLQIVLEGMAPRANISEVCRRYGINSTTYYEWKRKARATLYYQPRPVPHRRLHADEHRARESVRRVAFAHPSFGYRRIWSVLWCQEGRFINRKRVRRILKEEGLRKEVHFPRPRLPETGNLRALESDQRWYADLTYVDTTDLGPVP